MLKDKKLSGAALLVLIALVVILAPTLLRHFLSVPFWDRNASRLVGAFCLKYGLPLYPSLASGAVQSMNYPPLAAWAFYPVTFFNSPSLALFWAAVLNAFYFAAPVALFVRLRKLSATWAGLLLVGFFLGVIHCSALAYSGLRVHADAPALGLLAVSAWALLKDDRLNGRSLFWSTGLFALAVFTKQSVLPSLLGSAGWLLYFHGGKRAAQYIVGAGIWMAIFLAITFVWVPPATLFLNIVFIAKKPMIGPSHWFGFFQEIILDGWFFWLILILLMGWALRQKSVPRRQVLKNPLLLLALSLCLLPVALMNRAIVGGDVNAYSLVLYFVALATIDLLAQLWRGDHPKVLQVQWIALAAFVAIGLHDVKPLLRPGLGPLLKIWKYNPQQQAYEYLKRYPRSVYFPWNPLSQLMAERALFHFDPALEDWALSGHPLSEQRYRSGIPAEPRAVAFYSRNEFGIPNTLKHQPQLKKQESPAEMGAWVFYGS